MVWAVFTVQPQSILVEAAAEWGSIYLLTWVSILLTCAVSIHG